MEKIKIGRKSYPVKKPNDMNRREVREFQDAFKRAQANELDAVWDLLAAVAPTIPDEVLDELTASQIEQALRESGVIEGEEDEPSVGESSPSKDS